MATDNELEIEQVLRDVAQAAREGAAWIERVEPYMGLYGTEYVTPQEYLDGWVRERKDELVDLPLWDIYRKAENAISNWLFHRAEWFQNNSSLTLVQGTPGEVDYTDEAHELVRRAGTKAKALCLKRRNLALCGPVKEQTDLDGNIVEASEFWGSCYEYIAERGMPEEADTRKFVSKMATYAVDQKEKAEAEIPLRNESGGRVRILPQAIDSVIETLAAVA